MTVENYQRFHDAHMKAFDECPTGSLTLHLSARDLRLLIRTAAEWGQSDFQILTTGVRTFRDMPIVTLGDGEPPKIVVTILPGPIPVTDANAFVVPNSYVLNAPETKSFPFEVIHDTQS